ncbi:uncharacterized protein LOC118179311 [Stegodyphus dumicola]|uniref:uncharacterized protein LOC118179311 n=1 Tax=Stegodyphus dumicola TaxID=202533 RepID=UPI0015B30A27|nr:uncharacterized protein LOC118179311 [Stegodyphus dumicola]
MLSTSLGEFITTQNSASLLGLVPLNGADRRFNSIKGCRRCNHDLETLPYVLCHCMRYSRLYRDRHNAVVERIKKAAAGRWQIMSEDRMIDGQPLRPDLVLTNGDACIIIDVTIPFDNRRDAFDRARREKEEKYRPLVDALKNRFSNVRVEAIVVGALGSWDPKNDRVVRRLCSRKYAALMRKLAVSDTIRSSRDIYVEHVTGTRQNTVTGSRQNTVAGTRHNTARSNTGGESRNDL